MSDDPRLPTSKEITVADVHKRDAESAATWFKQPAVGACGQAFIDRRFLLGEMEHLQTLLERIVSKSVEQPEAIQLQNIASEAFSGDSSAPETKISELHDRFARAYSRLQCADVPRGPWHTEVGDYLLFGDSPLETAVAPTPEHAKTGTYITIRCDGCGTQADLPRVGREGEFMSLQPAKGWQLYPKHLCPQCQSSGKASVQSILDRKVTVCDKCHCACCWQGEFMCDEAKGAGTVEMTVRELFQGNLRENSEYWFKDPNTGKIDYDAKSAAKRAWLAENG